VLLGVATLVVGLWAADSRAGGRDAAVVLLAVAMGIQNAVARHLAVPDLTTTVLTMTLTGIASDLRRGVHGVTFARRLLAVLSMFAGAVVGAVLVLHKSPTAALVVGTALVALVAAASWRTTGDSARRVARS
jgi:uncharacterized membrane protein YoaK (UPF0700 family)